MATEQELLSLDTQARRDALDVSRSFIVQAPAGSGKTELLIQRYLQLLATVDNPEEVLAITFTRKAAAEMRLRVLQALANAQSGAEVAAEHERVTARAARAVLERDAARDWGLLTNSARMRIQTLDALNASIARMLPLTASVSGLAVVDDHDMRALYSDAAAATLDWLAEDDNNGVAARQVLAHVDGNSGIYIGQLARMLGTRDQWLPFIRSGHVSDEYADSLRKRFESNLEYIVEQHLDMLRQHVPQDLAAEFLALIPYAIDNLVVDGKSDAPLCAWQSGATLPGTTTGDLAQWLGLADLLLTGTGTVRKRLTKTQGFPTGDDGQKAALSAVLESLTKATEFVRMLHAARQLPPITYSDEQWSVLLALFRLLPVAAGELKRLSLARGLTDHTEIAITAGEALGSADNPGDVALLLDYQVRHILVDEMQDTSLAQYRMLAALTGGWEPGDGRTLFCVGDPMQSIYRFRNANVAEFLVANERGIGNIALESLLLRRNFRSGENLVCWFNTVFPKVLPASDDPVNGAVRYAAAVPVNGQRGKGSCEVHPVFGVSNDAEANTGASVLADLTTRHPDDSIAVLVRSRTQLPDLLQKLRTAGIPYQAIEIDRLTDLPEIIDVLALTRALVHPGDRLAWLAVLRSPWIGLDWTDLHSLVRNAQQACVLDLLQDSERVEGLSAEGRSRVQETLPVLFSAIETDRSASLRNRVERAWFALDGPALLADQNAVENVYRFFAVLSRIETAGSIADIAELANRLDAERITTNTSANVQVMTMHKSKGLQFDHVLLYGLGRPPASDQPAVLSWVDLPGSSEVEHKLISPIGRRDVVERDPLHVYIESTQKAKDDYEKGRLLYVACTRAKKTLHLVGNVNVGADDRAIKAPRANSLLALLWPIVEPEFGARFDASQVHGDDEDGNVLAQPRLRRIVNNWQLPQVDYLPEYRRQPHAGQAAEQRVEYYWVGSDARLAGTVVHRWLQRFADGRMQLTEETLASCAATSRKWLCELGASDMIIESVATRVTDALQNVLNDPAGMTLLEGEGATELELTGLIDGEIESVVIDRVRIDDAGEHWIIDYKTSTHEGGNLEGFLAAEAARYRPQLTRYASIYSQYAQVPVRCALYFPLLGRLVEVPLSR